MAITTESDIAKALNDHLKALSGAWPIAFPSVPFTPPTSGKYYRATVNPSAIETRGLGRGGYVHRGVYQVNVITPNNIGEIAAKNEAGKIQYWFEYGTRIATPSGELLIDKLPEIRGSITGGLSCEIPVIISYQLTTD